MPKLSLSINKQPIEDEVDDTTLLVTFLREGRGLTGTHIGCDTSQCGACVVMMDGVSVKSCTLLARQADGKEITTIEGVANGADLHPMQQAFRQAHGLQCGYCTPGMVISAIDYVEKGGALDDASIRAGLEGNMCRCTGYHNIIKAVQQGAVLMGKGAPQ
ncbi:MAG: (2Fe-2S)-binding protein [Candidatus Puniceispirillaceae bacterium]